MISARRPKATIRTHSVASFFSPVFLSFHVDPHAIDRLATAAPFGVYRISGSRPSRPMPCHLFRSLAITVLLLLLDAFVYFLAVDRYLLGRGYANPYLIALYPKHGYLNVVADVQCFSDTPR